MTSPEAQGNFLVHQFGLAKLHEFVEPLAKPLLGPLGFECVGPLKWVRSTDAPIRQVFCLLYLKTKAWPFWGLSLDFVPHVSGRDLKWHRTPKSARLDLCFQAEGWELAIPCTYLQGSEDRTTVSKTLQDIYLHSSESVADHIRNRAAHVIPKAVSEAREVWSRVQSIADLPAAFEWIRDYLSSRPGLGFYNFTQHPIAYAFALAINGRSAEGQQELNRYIAGSRRLDQKSEARLRRLFSEVQQHP